METTRKIDLNGNSCSTNLMLDDVIDIVQDKHRINNDELIKELTIDKIEYGRRCIAQFFVSSGSDDEVRKKMSDHYENLDNALQEKIKEVGGIPTVKTFIYDERLYL